MPSPFPGMDPYLEAHWGDVHHRLVNYACDALRQHLPSQLFARMEERGYIETPEELAVRVPDVRVIESQTPLDQSSATVDEVAVAEPVVLNIDADPVIEGFIEIREAGAGDRLITVIEVLSPANKKVGSGQWQYQRKQKECKQAGVSLVEIDLLRGGDWTVLAPKEMLPSTMRSPYRICVWSSWSPSAIEFYHAPFRQRLPAIRIPLRDTDPHVVLDIQALIDRAYKFGRYDRTDYSINPQGTLADDDASWLDALVRERGKRK